MRIPSPSFFAGAVICSNTAVRTAMTVAFCRFSAAQNMASPPCLLQKPPSHLSQSKQPPSSALFPFHLRSQPSLTQLPDPVIPLPRRLVLDRRQQISSSPRLPDCRSVPRPPISVSSVNSFPHLRPTTFPNRQSSPRIDPDLPFSLLSVSIFLPGEPSLSAVSPPPHLPPSLSLGGFLSNYRRPPPPAVYVLGHPRRLPFRPPTASPL